MVASSTALEVCELEAVATVVVRMDDVAARGQQVNLVVREEVELGNSMGIPPGVGSCTHTLTQQKLVLESLVLRTSKRPGPDRTTTNQDHD